MANQATQAKNITKWSQLSKNAHEWKTEDIKNLIDRTQTIAITYLHSVFVHWSPQDRTRAYEYALQAMEEAGLEWLPGRRMPRYDSHKTQRDTAERAMIRAHPELFVPGYLQPGHPKRLVWLDDELLPLIDDARILRNGQTKSRSIYQHIIALAWTNGRSLVSQTKHPQTPSVESFSRRARSPSVPTPRSRSPTRPTSTIDTTAHLMGHTELQTPQNVTTPLDAMDVDIIPVSDCNIMIGNVSWEGNVVRITLNVYSNQKDVKETFALLSEAEELGEERMLSWIDTSGRAWPIKNAWNLEPAFKGLHARIQPTAQQQALPLIVAKSIADVERLPPKLRNIENQAQCELKLDITTMSSQLRSR